MLFRSKFHLAELVMYKSYTPESMLHPTYKGPVRITDLDTAGATLRDPKTGASFSVSYENLRKISFEELLSLLPQNFDDEIARAIGNYRYRRASTDVQQDTESTADYADKAIMLPEDVQPKDTRQEDTCEPETEDTYGLRKKTRSGRIYLIKNKDIPSKYQNEYKNGILRLHCVPVLTIHDTPRKSCLKKTVDNVRYSSGKAQTRDKITFLSKCDEYDEDDTDYKRSTFGYKGDCTLQFTLQGDNNAGRVKFGTVQILLF